MAAFERHRENSKIDAEHEGTPWRDAGYVAWLLWGGDTGVEWAQRKSDELDRADEEATDNQEPGADQRKLDRYKGLNADKERPGGQEPNVSDFTFPNYKRLSLAETDQRWVKMFKLNSKTRHPAGDFETNDAFWKAFRKGFEHLRSNGYVPPVLRQHKSDGKGKDPRPEEDGFTYGKLVDIKRDDGFIMGKVEVPKAVARLIDEGYIENWSPSFYEDWEHPHTGERLKVAPRHHSFVSVSHQKNLGKSSPFYSLRELQEAAMADEKGNAEGTENADDGEKSMEEYMEGALADFMAKVMARFDALEEKMGGTESAEDEEPEMGDDKEMKELREQLAKKEEELRAERRKRRSDKLTAKFGIEGDELDEVLELAETDPDAYTDKVVELAEAPSKRKRQSEIGTAGSAPKAPVSPDRKTFHETVDKYVSEGHKTSKAIELAESDLGMKAHEIS
jgi:hypothetical protein